MHIKKSDFRSNSRRYLPVYELFTLILLMLARYRVYHFYDGKVRSVYLSGCMLIAQLMDGIWIRYCDIYIYPTICRLVVLNRSATGAFYEAADKCSFVPVMYYSKIAYISILRILFQGFRLTLRRSVM